MLNNTKTIYMDYQATTPVDQRVFDVMAPYFTKHFGNASSSVHSYGWIAEEAVKQAREGVADILGATSPSEIVFTSGATESNNLAILGVARRYPKKGRHLITAATEHKAVLDPCKAWEAEGGSVTYLEVNSEGIISLEQLRKAITPGTILISIMHANNEIGVIQPMAEIGQIARAAGVLFHTDATQSAGKIPFNVEDIPVDLASMSGHKIYGPKGIGVLYVRRRGPRVSLMPLLFGGGHESGRRSGTLNVPGIVGFQAALRLSNQERVQEASRVLKLRNKLWNNLNAQLEGLSLNGSDRHRLPGNLNFCVENLEVSRLFQEIPHIAISSKSACSSDSGTPSHVLTALGRSPEQAQSALRIGIGRFTTEEEVAKVANDLSAAIRKVKETSTQFTP